MAKNPLTQEDLTRINDSIAQLNDVQEQIRLARQAGIDVSEEEQETIKQREQLLKLKQTYFPGQ